MKRLWQFVIVAVAAACATNPATGRRQLMLMSESQEIQLGKESDQQVRQEMGVYSDAELQKYIASVGARLSKQAHRPNLPWTYTVVDASAVNAFALPGGFIYITRGIMPFLRDESELAGVLGHETGHVDARHGAAQYSTQTALGGALAVGSVLSTRVGSVAGLASQGLQLAFLKNSRDDELEADRLGVGYASKAGWTPEAMSGVLGTLGRLDEATGSSRGIPNWALTHPPAEDRVAKVQEAIAAARANGGTATNRSEYERHLENMVYGDSREQGMVRENNEFVHPIMKFSVRFPEGWEVMNGGQQVQAQPKSDTPVAIVLQLADGSSANPSQSARDVMAKSGFTEVDGGDRTINGLPAYVGTFQGQMNNTPVGVRAAFIKHGQAANKFFMLAGIAGADQFAGARGQFDNTIGTFKPISDADADRIQPYRIKFYDVRSGDTWESIAKSQSGGKVSATTLAIMNGSAPGTPPRTGDRVRIVAGG
jgi:predicted Zn-dependent protease